MSGTEVDYILHLNYSARLHVFQSVELCGAALLRSVSPLYCSLADFSTWTRNQFKWLRLQKGSRPLHQCLAEMIRNAANHTNDYDWKQHVEQGLHRENLF